MPWNAAMAILVNHPLSFATFSMAMSNYQRVKLGGGLLFSDKHRSDLLGIALVN